ncbi:hypothetical protein [Streptomyces sp. NRRL S-481]|uniref:hypothetical protein n=1 Tax=Streptomyces sp. NRRL S-481 TaxID=1463911 RepID=UPI00068CAF45|nr:hypothetical protein [Streptomyces sp. NRRL S-481]
MVRARDFLALIHRRKKSPHVSSESTSVPAVAASYSSLALGERRAKLLADPLKVTVDGVVTMDLQENLRGIERHIEVVRQVPAPEDEDEASETLAVARLVPTRRYR